MNFKPYPHFQKFIHELVATGAHPEAAVLADVDPETHDVMPAVVYMFVNQGQSDYGIWDGTLHLSLVCEVSEQDEFLRHTYNQVREWGLPSGGKNEELKLSVHSVDEVVVHQLVHLAKVKGKHVTQFDSQFTLRIKDWS